MIAYKGFRKDLTCTMGNGIFQYEKGIIYREKEANCAKNGFHSVEEPLEVLTWYSGSLDRYFVVKLGGDINEDGKKISSSEITLVKELTRRELYMYEVRFLMEHPQRESTRFKIEKGEPELGEQDVIVRGKNPKGRGKKGDRIYLLQEGAGREIEKVGVIEIDGTNFKEGKCYGMEAVL